MIYESEILKGSECPEEFKANLLELLVRVNKLRDAWGFPMIVTSGFRSMKDHRRIYSSEKLKNKKIPMSSKHLSCQAVDIYDPERKLQKWIVENTLLMKEIGLWFERFDYTPNWVHIQIVPPKSKSLFFIP